MRVKITARHFRANDDIKKFITKEIVYLEKFKFRIIDCEIILSYIKSLQQVEINIKVKKHLLSVTSESDDIYKAIDLSFRKMERQLRKLKTRTHKFVHEKAIDYVDDDDYFEEEE